MSRYTASDARRNSLTVEEREAIEQALNKMQAVMPAQREAFVAKIKAAPTVKFGGVELSKNAASYLISQIERMD